ncbi:hypothetical protein GCK72_010687 [Caenorhabditis remanei]|uniref:Tetratricopeptide repeat protein 21B n=1 Tax=Caenorhabditis remanei TaxID=31234 RepID=A0A6A5H5S6_CAERE|nr:hypothetical protein GCK72_010687 [Caenorhabditis remanei]KAF1762425.1 hypothetical protein GCK72_010687 [Caenorhabditis remanei]
MGDHAELLYRRREFSQAIDVCKQALQYHETDLKANLLLSKIYKEENKWTLVLQPCQTVIQVDPHNDEANSILADFYYIKSEADNASTGYTALLNKNSQHWHALSRVVELFCRNGEQLTAEKYLDKAKEVNPRCVTESGYNVCRGRFEWYTGDQNQALRYYSRTKDSCPIWREKALYYMIDICLNPDHEIIIDANSVENPETTVIEEASEQQKLALHYLDLLGKLPITDRYLLAQNFIRMHTTDKSSIQAALEEFNKMAFNADRTQIVNVGAVFGVARGHMLLKQLQKAKTVLKMVIGRIWNFDDSDYLEKCWLLLAEIYVNQNKTDQAVPYLDLVLKYNCNCLKAFEAYGFMREREQKYVEAYKMYEKAFGATKERNPMFGYKLAFTYLKARRLFPCIETCQKVLDLNPQYPKIKKEIMDKAIALIRT